MKNQVHPAVKAIIRYENKFLIVKQTIGTHSVWDLPGGKVQYGESPYNALLREVEEEVKLTIRIIRPIGLFWFFRQDSEQVVCTAFLCTVDNNKIDLSKNPDADENIIDYKWVTKDEILKNEFEVSHESLTNLFTLV